MLEFSHCIAIVTGAVYSLHVVTCSVYKRGRCARCLNTISCVTAAVFSSITLRNERLQYFTVTTFNPAGTAEASDPSNFIILKTNRSNYHLIFGIVGGFLGIIAIGVAWIWRNWRRYRTVWIRLQIWRQFGKTLKESHGNGHSGPCAPPIQTADASYISLTGTPFENNSPVMLRKDSQCIVKL